MSICVSLAYNVIMAKVAIIYYRPQWAAECCFRCRPLRVTVWSSRI